MGVSTVSTDFTTANVSVTTACVKISTASPEVKIAGDSVDDIAAKSLVYIRRSAAMTKDKGKGIMEESKSAMTKTKRQQEQERLGLETTARLQEEFDEEERKKIAKVHEAARSFSEVEWEDIRARVEASEELVQRLQTEEREKYSEDDQAKMLESNTFVPMETEIRRGVPVLVADSLQATVTESTEAGVPEEEMNIEALQMKYPIIDWEVYTEDSRMYWKIIWVVYILGSDEGRMQHNELMDLVTKLSDRVVALDTDLTQTKKVYGAAFTKLIKRVKRYLAQEDPSKHGRKIAQIDEDEEITLVHMGVSTASTDFTTTNVPVTTAGAEISTAGTEVKTD
ncbi:hypothetical protein Tco_0685449, partial [Tanacetum coccineum]